MHQPVKIKSVLVYKCFVFTLNDRPTEQTNLGKKSSEHKIYIIQAIHCHKFTIHVFKFNILTVKVMLKYELLSQVA